MGSIFGVIFDFRWLLRFAFTLVSHVFPNDRAIVVLFFENEIYFLVFLYFSFLDEKKQYLHIFFFIVL